MSDPHTEILSALDRMVDAMRAHLAAVLSADEPAGSGGRSDEPAGSGGRSDEPAGSGGRSDEPAVARSYENPPSGESDEAVWRAYIELNNAAQEYDELLNEVYGEVTPFDLEPITGEADEGVLPGLISVSPTPVADDPYPRVVSVRQRRDYRVPSVAALLRVAELGRPAPAEGETYEPVRTVGDAVIELLQSGDGSLAMLDVPELEPLDGVVVVAEVDAALPPEPAEGTPAAEADQPFRLAAGDAVVAHVHESAVTDTQSGGPAD